MTVKEGIFIDSTDSVSIALFLQQVVDEIERARKKFPTNGNQLHAFNKNAGDLNAVALSNFSGKATEGDIRKECAQAAAMAARLYLEGDMQLPYKGISDFGKDESVDLLPMDVVVRLTLYGKTARVMFRDSKVAVIDDPSSGLVSELYSYMESQEPIPWIYQRAIDED